MEQGYPLLFQPQPSSSSRHHHPMMASNAQLFGSFYGSGGSGGAETGVYGVKEEEEGADKGSLPSQNHAASSAVNNEMLKGGGDDDEAKPGKKKVRRPRYAFQTRSQVDILDDGYRWRKYGQKAVKNNSFPRSYYKCTHQGCIVKKQVQRLSKDEGVVVTTYEGMHTHPIDKSKDNFEHILNQMKIYSALIS